MSINAYPSATKLQERHAGHIFTSNLLAKAHSGYEALLQYGRTILKEKIIFGSAFPMMPVETALAELEALGLEEPVRQLWLHDNAARLLNLPARLT